MTSKQWLIIVCSLALVAIAFLNIDASARSDLGDDIFLIHVPTKKTNVKIGEKIVAAAFNSSYYELTKFCNVRHRHYKICLRRIYHRMKNKTLESSKSFPWWYKTFLRDVSRPKTLVHGIWHVLQYLNPNIQQCIAEKVGTKVWRELHCMTIEDKEAKAKAKKRTFSKFNCNYLQRNRVQDSDRVVFTRDPLDRFLSGFLDKCVGPKVHSQGHCEPNVVFKHNANTTPVPEFQTDSHTLFDIYVDTFPLTWNLHFIPQSMYCDGLYRHIGEYNFVGSMDKDLYRDLRRFRDKYPELEGPIEITFNLSTVGETATNSGVETKAAEKTKLYYTPRTVQKVLEYYSIDYVMLGLSIPDWAEEMLAQGDPVVLLT